MIVTCRISLTELRLRGAEVFRDLAKKLGPLAVVDEDSCRISPSTNDYLIDADVPDSPEGLLL